MQSESSPPGSQATAQATAAALLSEPECVHCGFCLPACPTYDLLGTEMDSPRGRLHTMRALETGRVAPTESLVKHLDLCLLCHSCETACPSGVPFAQLMQETRETLVGKSVRPRSQRLLDRLITWAVALPPGVQRVGIVLLQLAERLGLGRRLAEAAQGSGPRAAAAGLLLSSPPDGVSLPDITPAVGIRKQRVALLPGCVARWTFGRVNQQTASLLAAAGCEVVVPPASRCCGALHAHGGRTGEALALARRNIAAFEEVGELDAILVNAAGCGTALKDYGRLLADDPQWAARAKAFAARTFDALEYLGQQGAEGGPRLPTPLREVKQRVAYHDACHLAHGQGVRNAPRELLERIPGLELVPLADADRCCGSAGIYNLLHPTEASGILDPKLMRLAASGATIVAAANPGCLMQLAAGARRAGLAIETRHPIELLAEAHL